MVRKTESSEQGQVNKADSLMVRQHAMVERCEKKQILRRSHVERREALKAEKIKTAEAIANLKLRQAEQTNRLVQELSRRKSVEAQKSLKTKKVKPVQGRSIPESVYEEFDNRMREERKQIEAEEKLLENIQSKDDSVDKRRIEAEEKKRNYRRDLKNQLINNRIWAKQKREEKLRERQFFMEAQEAIIKEKLEEEKRKKETAFQLQTERDDFLKAKEIWKAAKKQDMERDHEELARVVREKEAKEKREAEKKTADRGLKDEMAEKLKKHLAEEHKKRIEREEITRELYLAEKDVEVAQEAARLIMKKKQNAKELLSDMMRAYKSAAEKKVQENEVEMNFAQYLAEQERNFEEKERQKQKARREKNVQYGNELKVSIVCNSARRAVKASKKRCPEEMQMKKLVFAYKAPVEN